MSKRKFSAEDENNSGNQKIKLIRDHSFNLNPLSKFDLPFPSYRQPTEIGCFSLDAKRDFTDGSSQLRYYCSPNKSDQKEVTNNLGFDLRKGYDQFIEKVEKDEERLNDLLRWILHNRKFIVKDQSSLELNADFVCWRGLLTKIICTVYENREGWRISAMKFKNTLYLCDYETEQKAAEKLKESDFQKEASYWGFKFEQYMTSDSVDSEPDTSRPVNNNNAFVSVVRTQLDNNSLVFGGEVDCCIKTDKKHYIELKTSRKIDTPNQMKNFKRFKLIKWWAQSFIIGVPEIVCGFRDDSGVVINTKSYLTTDIERLCRAEPNIWRAPVCFNFCSKFLDFVKESVQLDCDKLIKNMWTALPNSIRAVYVFDWMPHQPITCRVEKPDSKYAFLPDWYKDSFNDDVEQCN